MKIVKRTENIKILRQNNIIPGVIYGKEIESTPIQVEYLELVKALKKYGTNMTFKVKLDNKEHIVYIRQFQNDYLLNYKPTHFDLVKVSLTDTITSHVPLNFLHKDNIAKSGEVLSINLNDLEVEYKVGSGVSHIDVDLTKLLTDDTVYVSDVVAPEGVTVLNKPTQIIANLTLASILEETVDEDDEDVVVTTLAEEE